MKTLLDRLDGLANNMGSAIYEDAETCGEAAAELRRLHALNAELLAELENCVDLLVMCFSDAPVDSCIGAAIKNGNAAIRARGQA